MNLGIWLNLLPEVCPLREEVREEEEDVRALQESHNTPTAGSRRRKP